IDGVSNDSKFEYDTVSLLVAYTVNGTRTEVSFDVNGNRLPKPGLTGATFDAHDRLVSFDGWDVDDSPSGDLPSTSSGSDGFAYFYDELSNLLSVSNIGTGDNIDYIVDGLGRRIGRHKTNALTHGWIYQDQLNPIAEYLPDGTIT